MKKGELLAKRVAQMSARAGWLEDHYSTEHLRAAAGSVGEGSWDDLVEEIAAVKQFLDNRPELRLVEDEST